MDVRNLSRQLSEIDQRRLYRQEVTARTAAARMEAWAKANKRWKDHTGHAVGGLRGRSARSGAVITITLSGSVRYMVYLGACAQEEVRHPLAGAPAPPERDTERDGKNWRDARMMLERIYGALKGAGLDARLATLHSGRLHGGLLRAL